MTGERHTKFFILVLVDACWDLTNVFCFKPQWQKVNIILFCIIWCPLIPLVTKSPYHICVYNYEAFMIALLWFNRSVLIRIEVHLKWWCVECRIPVWLSDYKSWHRFVRHASIRPSPEKQYSPHAQLKATCLVALGTLFTSDQQLYGNTWG